MKKLISYCLQKCGLRRGMIVEDSYREGNNLVFMSTVDGEKSNGPN